MKRYIKSLYSCLFVLFLSSYGISAGKSEVVLLILRIENVYVVMFTTWTSMFIEDERVLGL